MLVALAPLGGKYYGTRLNFAGTSLVVWTGLGRTPSARQKEAWGWESMDPQTRSDMMSDSHYETEDNFIIASAVQSALAAVELPE